MLMYCWKIEVLPEVELPLDDVLVCALTPVHTEVTNKVVTNNFGKFFLNVFITYLINLELGFVLFSLNNYSYMPCTNPIGFKHQPACKIFNKFVSYT